ncbi:hypothetical protein HPSA50_0009 [Helicobacter pylori SouthAfrica50]|uniref:Uncharacterized protein n=1 Tax=Helicobacter pylori SouthAfrica50 TaxID=1352357 RepID=T2SAJ9_HELPX|nr:hypothetical protein HPSA50_0009 [Helicobacter pylori SouthAfrica50]
MHLPQTLKMFFEFLLEWVQIFLSNKAFLSLVKFNSIFVIILSF